MNVRENAALGKFFPEECFLGWFWFEVPLRTRSTGERKGNSSQPVTTFCLIFFFSSTDRFL